MNTKMMALAAGAALAVAGAAQAQTFEPKAAGHFMVNLRVTDIAPVDKYDVNTIAGASTGLRAKVSDDVKPTIGLTYFITDNIAVEAIAGTTKHEVAVVGPGVDVNVKQTWVLPPIVSLQYHFMPKQRFSPYVGAGVNYMIFYSGHDMNGFHLKIKDGWGAALQVGADYAISGPWSANLDVKKVFFDTTATDATAGVTSKVKLNPWVISAGVGYRF
jgi:outer membrane protein